MALPDFYEAALHIQQVGKFPHVTAADLIAVCMNESHGIGFFLASDPLYKINKDAAASYTGLDGGIIEEALTIPQGVWKGKLAKFRFEGGYWKWAKSQRLNDAHLRFLMSCSLGVGQQMTRWLCEYLPNNRWMPTVTGFMSSLDMQMEYLAGNLDNLMGKNNGDLFLAYKEYNCGNATSTNASVIARANKVLSYKQQALKELGNG